MRQAKILEVAATAQADAYAARKKAQAHPIGSPLWCIYTRYASSSYATSRYFTFRALGASSIDAIALERGDCELVNI